MDTNVLIIGGGPAGLAAAYESISHGLNVTIVEQSWSIGGQLRQQTQFIDSLPSGFGFGENIRGFELIDKLKKPLNSNKANILLQHTLVGMYKNGSLGVTDNKTVFPITANKIILATGAAEITVPFPKWTLPGVMTLGAAQIFINREKVKPGKSTVIVGSSDFGLEIAMQLHEKGIRVKGIIEKGNQLKATNIEYIKNLKSLGIPVFLKTEIENALGKNEVEKVVLRISENKTKEIEVDLVCTDGGFYPAPESFQLVGCTFSYNSQLGGWIPNYNKDLQTSKEHIYIAGDAAGITCHGSIILTGLISGVSVAESMNAISREEGLQRKQDIWRQIIDVESDNELKLWEARKLHLDN